MNAEWSWWIFSVAVAASGIVGWRVGLVVERWDRRRLRRRLKGGVR